MATYVLVHGGSHGGWCYQRVARILRAEGHEVYCPTMTGLGERAHLVTPDTDLDMHIDDVVSVLVYEDLYDVILAGHSYGGMVITGVADRALSRVGQLVYLDAAVPVSGESLVDVAPATMLAARESGRLVDGVELYTLPLDDTAGYFGVSDPETMAQMRSRLSPHPWKTCAQPLHLVNETAVAGIPRTMINCTPTLSSGIKADIGRSLRGDRVWEIDTGHDLMLTEPEALAEMLGRLASTSPRPASP